MSSARTARAVFACLADPTRVALMREFAEHGEATASTLAALIPVSRQAVTKHLQMLEQAGLVASRKAGRERRYRAEPAPLRATAEWLAQAADRWDTQLRLLKQAAEANPGPDDGHDDARFDTNRVTREASPQAQ